MMILATCACNSASCCLIVLLWFLTESVNQFFFYWHIFFFIAMTISEICLALSKFADRLQIRPVFTCSVEQLLGMPHDGSLCHLQHFLILQWQIEWYWFHTASCSNVCILNLWAETKRVSINYSAAYKKWWVFNQYKSNPYKMHFTYN